MELLSLWQLLLILILCPVDLCVSGQSCAGKEPVIDPPFLLVEYGAPALATCRAQYNASTIGWETKVGARNEEDTQQLVWNVSSVTDWSLTAGATCYTSSDDLQCQTHLPITIYKIPDHVTLIRPTGPLIEGQQYLLECEVQSVAPVRLLSVTWFRGDKELKQSALPEFTIKGDPSLIVTVRTNLRFTASRDDHKSSYSCAAYLKTVDYKSTSNRIQLEVFYKPRVLNFSHDVSKEEGETVELSCSFDANPSPVYSWKHNNQTLANQNDSTLRIGPILLDQAGIYTCVASNRVGEASMEINMDVFRNQMGNIILVVLLVFFLLAVMFVIWWWKCKK